MLGRLQSVSCESCFQAVVMSAETGQWQSAFLIQVSQYLLFMRSLKNVSICLMTPLLESVIGAAEMAQ